MQSGCFLSLFFCLLCNGCVCCKCPCALSLSVHRATRRFLPVVVPVGILPGHGLYGLGWNAAPGSAPAQRGHHLFG